MAILDFTFFNLWHRLSFWRNLTQTPALKLAKFLRILALRLVALVLEHLVWSYQYFLRMSKVDHPPFTWPLVTCNKAVKVSKQKDYVKNRSSRPEMFCKKRVLKRFEKYKRFFLSWRYILPHISAKIYCNYIKKQPSRGVLVKGVLKICSKFTGEHPCRNVISISCKATLLKSHFGMVVLL